MFSIVRFHMVSLYTSMHGTFFVQCKVTIPKKGYITDLKKELTKLMRIASDKVRALTISRVANFLGNLNSTYQKTAC